MVAARLPCDPELVDRTLVRSPGGDLPRFTLHGAGASVAVAAALGGGGGGGCLGGCGPAIGGDFCHGGGGFIYLAACLGGDRPGGGPRISGGPALGWAPGRAGAGASGGVASHAVELDAAAEEPLLSP